MRFGLHLLGYRHKLGQVRVHASIRHQVAEALKKVSRNLHPGLRHPHPLLAPVNPEDGLLLALEEI